MITQEMWKPCPSYPGFEASNLGRVRRCIFGKDGTAPRMISGCIGSHGYLVSVTTIWGGRKNYRLHALVCDAFHGPRPEPDAEVRHLDGSRTNNVPSNICWGTSAENAQDKLRHGTQTKGRAVNTARLKETDLIEIKKLKSIGKTGPQIAEIYGVTRSTVNRFLKGETWRSVPTP